MIRFDTIERDSMFAPWKCGMPTISGSGSPGEFWRKLVVWITAEKGRMAECYDDDWHFACQEARAGQAAWKAGKHGEALVRLWALADFLTEISCLDAETLAIEKGQDHLTKIINRQRRDRRRGGAIGGAGMSGETALDERERALAARWRACRDDFATDSACAAAIADELYATEKLKTTAKTVLATATRLRLRSAKGSRRRNSKTG